MPVGADAGFERRIFGRRGRGLADIGRGQDELVEGDVADGLMRAVMAGVLLRRAGGSRLSPWKTRHKSPPLFPSPYRRRARNSSGNRECRKSWARRRQAGNSA